MVRTPMEDIERELKDPEYARLFGEADAKSEFAIALCRARDRAGITQKELADRLGVSQAYIAKLSAGDANPT
ncbi:MAG: helix-turn-helix domain-containing protein, partial [Chloroflexi bacterium]|nr:helix-turn-helix domain-containing protein [Chloroflexota bacterium]